MSKSKQEIEIDFKRIPFSKSTSKFYITAASLNTDCLDCDFFEFCEVQRVQYTLGYESVNTPKPLS